MTNEVFKTPNERTVVTMHNSIDGSVKEIVYESKEQLVEWCSVRFVAPQVTNNSSILPLENIEYWEKYLSEVPIDEAEIRDIITRQINRLKLEQ